MIDPETGEARLVAGVSPRDRDAFGVIHGHLPPLDAVREVVRRVRPFRRPGADPHPLNRFAPERGLRARLVEEPELIGARTLGSGVPPRPRQISGKEPEPAVAQGATATGEALLAVASVGVDLDVVPFAVDARMIDGRAPLTTVIVVPEGDDQPITHELAALLIDRVDVVTVPPEPVAATQRLA
jgi:hypothetical protein